MSSKQEQSGQDKKLAKKNELEQAEVAEVLGVIKKYMMPATIVLAVVCTGFIGYGVVRTMKGKKLAKACSALNDATTVDAYLNVKDKYASSPYAPIALLNVARLKFEQGSYSEADKLYSDFLAEYKDHEMALTAELSRITCKLAKGDVEGAANDYANFAGNHADSFLASAAKYQRALCLQMQGDDELAKQVYEELKVSNTAWSSEAANKLALVNSKLQVK